MSDEEEEEEPDDDIPYNHKKLPLGWDGHPIPYWLYKLHGLNRGPKAIQKHFAEWRHSHGMKCLGIPNTAHFANVTQIEDAMSEHEEEFEDSKGNVVNKKTLKDLKIVVICCILLNIIQRGKIFHETIKCIKQVSWM